MPRLESWLIKVFTVKAGFMAGVVDLHDKFLSEACSGWNIIATVLLPGSHLGALPFLGLSAIAEKITLQTQRCIGLRNRPCRVLLDPR